MSDFVLVLIVEDAAHEKFLVPLIGRMATAPGVPLEIRIRSAGGGSGRVLKELERMSKDCERGNQPVPDGIVVAVDSNCRGFVEKRNTVLRSAGSLAERVIPAIPDPHIERWFLLDGQAFKEVVGHGCQAPDGKCEKDRYKRLLNEAVLAAGVEPLLGGVEYAQDLAGSLDIERVCKADSSFSHFVSDLRAWLNRTRRNS